MLCLGLSAGFASAEDDVEVVQYYCSVGAYLIKLQEEIDKWNATTGAEEGVYIELISNINSYGTDLEALLQAGTFFDLIDTVHGQSARPGSSAAGSRTWRASRTRNFEALIASYEPYLQNGINIQAGMLSALPLEVVPIKLAVNLDLFEKNGLELPETWADIVECARIITENGNGEEFGYGWSTWSAMFRRLTFKATTSSTGRGWCDPNTETYDFSIYESPGEGHCRNVPERLDARRRRPGHRRNPRPVRRRPRRHVPGSRLRLRRVHLPVPGGVQLDRHRRCPPLKRAKLPTRACTWTARAAPSCAPAYDDASAERQAAIVKAFLLPQQRRASTRPSTPWAA